MKRMVNPKQLLVFYVRQLLHNKKAYAIAICSFVLVAAISISHPEKLKSTQQAAETPLQKTDSVIMIALQYQGLPYLAGGKTEKGFDCSGFTRYVFRQVGVNLNASAQSQYLQGKTIEVSELQPSDLVFFKMGSRISHVGIVLKGENGQINFIHAASTGIRIDALEQNYYKQRFVGARRIISV